ncbi:MAG: DUF4870 domain-containing protein [Acidimicrobiia bacterium]|nr:DUF4870 domain-containing protein [Acidimicrobiia bacterium]
MSEQSPYDPNAWQGQQQSGGAAAPGWYPDGYGQLRWWDGSAWGPVADAAPQATAAPNTGMAALAHILGLFLGFLGPLIMFVVADRSDPFARDQAAEALNFQLTVLIGWFVSFVLMFVLVGFLLIFVVLLVDFVLCILAAIAASRGEWYRYPINIRMVKP